MCLHHIPFPKEEEGKKREKKEGVLSPLVSDIRQPKVDFTNAICVKTYFQVICTAFYFIKMYFTPSKLTKIRKK